MQLLREWMIKLSNKKKGCEYAKGSETYLVVSSMGSSTHPSTWCVRFLMGLKSITISKKLLQIVWHRWPGAAGLVVHGRVCFWATLVLSIRDSAAWWLCYETIKVFVIDIDQSIYIYGNVILHKTKFHPNSCLILYIMILNLGRYIRNFRINCQHISSTMKPLFCTDLCFAIASGGAFSRAVDLISETTPEIQWQFY